MVRIPLPIKLMASYLLVAGMIVVPSVWGLRQAIDASLQQDELSELRRRAETLRDWLARVPEDNLDRAVREAAVLIGLRVTLINRAGVVEHDSELPPERVDAMENHEDRPEVLGALSGAVSCDQRSSAMVGKEMIYCAAPLTVPAPAIDGKAGPAARPTRVVVRVAAGTAVLHDSVSRALMALRLAAGMGVSAALGLSLFAAFFVSSPLRHMRDVARAFAQARWVAVRRVRTGDELEDLSLALEELGAKLREQLVEIGGQETLLAQAVGAFSLPAAIFGANAGLRPMLLNGAFRQFIGITASNEEAKLSELFASPQFAAARAAAEKSALPVGLSLAAVGAAGHSDRGGHSAGGTLVPLCRPSGAPLWLLLLDVQGPESEARGPEAVHLHLRGAETILNRLWDEHPVLRGMLARLRRKMDEAAHAAGRPEAVGIEPADGSRLISRCIEELTALYPEAAARLTVEVKTGGMLAESAGLLARAVRLFVGEALRVLPAGRTLDVLVESEPTVLRLSLEGAAPPDLSEVRELARALGTDAGRVKNREREAAWLTLPRA